jgi:hypothetical protein
MLFGESYERSTKQTSISIAKRKALNSPDKHQRIPSRGFLPNPGEDVGIVFKPSAGRQDAGLAPSNTIKTAGSFWSIELYTLRVKVEA